MDEIKSHCEVSTAEEFNLNCILFMLSALFTDDEALGAK
jgi:hypothetical protein